MGMTITRFAVVGCSSPLLDVERMTTGILGVGGTKGFLKGEHAPSLAKAAERC